MAKVKTQIPDGKGGWLDVEGDAQDGMKANTDKQEVAMADQWYADVAGLIEYLWKQGRLYQSENGLTNEQVAFAIGLLQVQCRQTYPKDVGGPERFDALHAAAWDYYKDATSRG